MQKQAQSMSPISIILFPVFSNDQRTQKRVKSNRTAQYLGNCSTKKQIVFKINARLDLLPGFVLQVFG